VKLSLVVPCYNEELVISETNKRLLKIIAKLLDSAQIADFEIIYIDDGSSDGTLNILKEIASSNKKVKIISFSRNFGHQSALTAGIWFSSGDAVISLDADLQDPPEIIEEMIEKFNQGYDVVYAVRRSRKEDTFFKRNSAKLFYKIMQMMGVDIIYNHADFRLLSKEVVKEFRKMKEYHRFIRGMIPYLGFKSTCVFYDRKKRIAGETKYPLMKMFSLAWNGITSFTYFPLRLALFWSIIVFLISILLVFFLLVTKIRGDSVSKWLYVVIFFCVLNGVQSLFLGFLGEYVGKIYIEIKKRPIFVVKEKINF